MINKSPLFIILALLMVLAAFLSTYLTPTIYMSDERKISLESIVPKQFGDWQLDKNQSVIEADPAMVATINRVYSETLSRSYINSRGERVMLAVAYGKNQSDGNNNVHLPEVCYPAQGFSIIKKSGGQLNFSDLQIPVTRLVAKYDTRIEPITYWVMVGDQAVADGMGQKKAQLTYGLSGKIPDGLLFRVSTISSDIDGAYRKQLEFTKDLFDSLSPDDRLALFGRGS